MTATPPEGDIQTQPRRTSGIIAAELRGDLRCARCTYNLKGLSITTVCPECGVPVRATLLHTVDPMAAELRPVRVPFITAHGLILWTGAALAAGLMVWCLRLADLLSYPAWLPDFQWMRQLIVLAAALSGVGALVLIRPQSHLPRRMTTLAAIGCALYIPLCLFLYRIHAVMDVEAPSPYGLVMHPRLDRSLIRLLELATLGAILLLLRPIARHLQARSFLMRTGRVDRQTMAAMLAVLGVIALGDILVLAAGGGRGPVQDILRQVGQLVILIGSMLFSLGLCGMLIDTLRMRAVILEPPLTLEDLIAPPAPSSAPAPAGNHTS
ncbi:MAG TPA: hypothetical protein VHN77_12850 [Phycisphaerales bacterium]|nr:hypothetical protein [Phycisphaerales bacterium]